MPRRVVVTGLGLVTALGSDVNEVWQKLLLGTDGTADLDQPLLIRKAQITRAAPIKNFSLAHLEPILSQERQLLRTAERATQFALVAALRAIRDAGLILPDTVKLNPELIDPYQAAVYVGLSMGDGPGLFNYIKTFLDPQQGPSAVHWSAVPSIMPNGPAGHVSIMLGAKRAAHCLVTACATGNDNIGHAYWLIKDGRAQLAIAGGCDNLAHPFYLACFGNLGALSRRGISCPFSQERDGFVMGEGAGILVLEEYERARERQAKIYAEVIGYGTSADAHHITAPPDDHEGGQRVIREALAEANLPPEAVDYINSHGTSTPTNDQTETVLLKEVFKTHAQKLLINSTKSMLGHPIGAAGAIEAIVTVLTLHQGTTHPTINFGTSDPDCDLNYCFYESRQHNFQVAGSTSLGFGGHNAFLLFKKI